MDDLTFSYSTDYYDYVNPLMGDLLSALGIERNFIKAEGTHYTILIVLDVKAQFLI